MKYDYIIAGAGFFGSICASELNISSLNKKVGIRRLFLYTYFF